MARYIDAIKLSRDLAASALKLNLGKTTERVVNIICKIVMDEPEADVEEVKHGEWKEHFAWGCWHYDCPFCDDGYATRKKDLAPPNYCGNCGAKMDGGKAE